MKALFFLAQKDWGVRGEEGSREGGSARVNTAAVAE